MRTAILIIILALLAMFGAVFYINYVIGQHVEPADNTCPVWLSGSSDVRCQP